MKINKILKDYKIYIKKAKEEKDYQYLYENILIECFYFAGEAAEGKINKVIDVVILELDKLFIEFAKINNSMNPFFTIDQHQFRSCLVISKPDEVTEHLFDSYGWNFQGTYKKVFGVYFKPKSSLTFFMG